MAEDDNNDDGSEDEPSFRERLEEAREQAPGGEGDPMGGMGGMGGNPFAQMMGGMMGGGMDSRMREEARETATTKELVQLREELADLTAQVTRIADALEDDD